MFKFQNFAYIYLFQNVNPKPIVIYTKFKQERKILVSIRKCANK